MQVLKAKSLLIHLIIAGILILITGCNFPSKRHYDVLTLKGASFASNFSNSSIYLGSEPKSEEEPELKLVVSPGDLVLILCEDETELYYRIKENDPASYTVSLGEMEDNGIYFGDRPITFQLNENDSSWMQFNDSDPTIIDRLAFIDLSFKVSEKQVGFLEQFSSYYRDIGLFLDEEAQPGLLNRLLPILQPEWLFISYFDPATIDKDAAMHLANIELLWISPEMQGAIELLSYCPNLKQLIVQEWKPEHGDLGGLKHLHKLTSLTISGNEFKDLSSIQLPPSLSRLHLCDCNELTDISALKSVPKLASLSLSFCEEIADLSLLNNLPDLQYLSFPPHTTQEEFEQIIQDQRKLEVIELNDCENISDLSILKDQLKLKALILNDPGIDLAQLHELDHPDLILLERDYFDKQPEAIEALQTALPETDIYPGGAFCLGSGWLFLILPFLLTIRYIAYLKHRNK